MLDWLGAINPTLFAWGALAVASPIIIHLLSKRKFKIVNWAAMDFLLDANRRNRRRVKLENLLLLLLRCLAVLLLAALVARPFLMPTGLLAGAIKATSLERIVLLDDSPSMGARSGKGTVFQDAQEGLVDFVNEMATQRSGDTFTLILTSQPEHPLFAGRYMRDRVDEVTRQLKDLKVSDTPAKMESSLEAVKKALANASGNPNRIVYLISDMRSRDWLPGREGSKDPDVPKLVREISQLDRVDGCFLVDVGNDSIENLQVTEITPLTKTLVAGNSAKFQVKVKNAGGKDVDDVDVKFSPGEALELTNRIPIIRAGETETTQFEATFREVGAAQVRAEATNADVLRADNTRYFAARVREGVAVLVVNGESSEGGEESSFFVQHALIPPGAWKSGVVITPMSSDQFEAAPLDDFQVIYLCNVAQVSEKRAESLEKWVAKGGGLCFGLGSQVDERSYNEQLYRDGKGLLPVRLDGILGDDTQKKWVHFSVENPNHPVVKDPLAFLLKDPPVFRWWNCVAPAEELKAARTVVPMRFDDADSSPAMIERPLGKGRVVVLATSLDKDWSFWPELPESFVIFLQELNNYLSRGNADEGNVTVGNPIVERIDATKYDGNVRITPPAGETQSIQAAALAGDEKTDASKSETAKSDTAKSGTAQPESSELTFRYDDTSHAGTYAVTLTRKSGETESLLFAANLDPSEGDLHRVEDGKLHEMFKDSRVQLEHGRQALSLGATGSRAEIWQKLLLCLCMVLCVEQVCGWLFGRRRQ